MAIMQYYTVAMAVALFCPPALSAEVVFLEDTRLLNVNIGSSFEALVRQTSQRSLELESGKTQNFKDWYSSKWKDFSITLENPISQNSWIYWGFSTGETAEKYIISPSIILGLEQNWEINDRSFFTVTIKGKLGGNLREKTCIASYSLIDGPTAVNCRLAASILAPSETLKYLWDDEPADRLIISFKYTMFF